MINDSANYSSGTEWIGLMQLYIYTYIERGGGRVFPRRIVHLQLEDLWRPETKARRQQSLTFLSSLVLPCSSSSSFTELFPRKKRMN